MAEHGIEVVLGTPTAAPPGWLIAEHPDILPVDHEGRVFPFGHRRHYCPNNATYHQESRRIVAALAERYGADERVVAWQIDNEFGERCYCPRCEVAFREWLEERYGSLERLNASWGTAFWSQTYGSWDHVRVPPAGDVPLPEGFLRASPSPAHALDYRPLRLGQLRSLSAAADRRDPSPLGPSDHAQPEGLRVQGARLPEAGAPTSTSSRGTTTRS